MDTITPTQILLLSIIFLPLTAVIFNRLRMDIAALLIAAGLGAAQFLGASMLGPAGSPKDAVLAVSGFGQPIVITLICLFILTRGLEKSGVTRWIARRLMAVGGSSETRLIGLLAATTAVLSLLMNSLAAVALLLPSAIEISRRTKIYPSKLLIPVAFGSLLGGSATYFTTANIIISDLLRIAQPPQYPLKIFDFTPTGGLIAVAGIAFLTYFGNRMLPNRPPAREQLMARLTGSELEDIYRLGERLWEARVHPESEIAGKSLAQSGIGQRLGVEVAAIWHGRQAIFSPPSDQIISPDDILLIIGREERVKQLEAQGISIGRDKTNEHISPYGLTMLEIMPAPHSSVVGHTLKELDFRHRFGFTAVALRRPDQSYRTNVGDITLALGDSLLLIGRREALPELQKDRNFIVLQPSLSDQPVERRPAFITSLVILGAVAASALGIPIFLAMLVGALVILLSSVISMEEAYTSIEWQAIFVIAGMYAASLGMIHTGLADILGRQMVRLATPFGALGLAAGAYLLSVLLTQIMGGQVTALVSGPIAISAAIAMGVNPQAVAVAAAIGCSACFLTPFAHPANIMIIAQGNYSLRDFLQIGWRLTLLSFLMLLVGLAFFWGL